MVKGQKCTEGASLDVYEWIVQNVTPYDGDESFLARPTEKTAKLWGKCKELLAIERSRGGVLAIDVKTPSTITSHSVALIDQELDNVVVGLQGESPLQRTMKPLGGYRLVKVRAQRERTLDSQCVSV